MQRLSEHEQSGAIWNVKAGVRVSDVASQQLYSTPEIITRLLKQLKIDAGLDIQE